MKKEVKKFDNLTLSAQENARKQVLQRYNPQTAMKIIGQLFFDEEGNIVDQVFDKDVILGDNPFETKKKIAIRHCRCGGDLSLVITEHDGYLVCRNENDHIYNLSDYQLELPVEECSCGGKMYREEVYNEYPNYLTGEMAGSVEGTILVCEECGSEQIEEVIPEEKYPEYFN